MHRQPRRLGLRPLTCLVALAGALVVDGAQAAPAASNGGTVTAALTPTPPPVRDDRVAPVGPAPRAAADSKRMWATTFTNMVVYENGAGYLHAFWRTLGTQGPDASARLQWGRGCPEISDRVFMAIHTAFSSPDRFFLIVDKAPDARQPGAYCVTAVEVERINTPQPPPLIVTPPPTPPAGAPPSKPLTAAPPPR